MIYAIDVLNHVTVYVGDNMDDCTNARNDYKRLMGLTEDTCTVVKFSGKPKRCYMCCGVFAESDKPLAVLGGTTAPGYICPSCYAKLFKKN